MTVLSLVFLLLGVSMITALEMSKCKLDLGLLVDTTKSIKEENIPKVKEALRKLVNKFSISTNGTHVSLLTFHKKSKIHNKFNDDRFHNNKAMEGLINSSFVTLLQPTRLDIALKTANSMLDDKSGKRSSTRCVMVLFTDGRSHPATEEFFLEVVGIKIRGCIIVVVGVGPDAKIPKYRKVLEFIGGKNLFFVVDYDSLDDATNDIAKLICPPDPCKNSKGMDVSFVIDKTSSLGVVNFLLLKGFLLQLIDAMHIGPNATHTGIITFNRKPKVRSTFADEKMHSNEAVHEFVTKMSVDLGDRTFIDKALLAANNRLFTERGGDRPKFPNVLILFTDGRTNSNSKPFSEITPLLKAKAVRIIVVGIGQYEDFQGQLEEIAGKNVHNPSNFDELSDLFDNILAETCSVDGGFSRWSFWTDCHVTCGDGYQIRTRTCTYPTPQGYGEDCHGPDYETRLCNEKPCPPEVDGGQMPLI